MKALQTGTTTGKPRGLWGRSRALLAVGLLGGSLTLGGCATPEGNAALLGAGLGVLVGVAIAADYDDDKDYRKGYRRGYRHGHYDAHPCPYGY
ncbi:MAG: hypothetical protein AAF750_09910 [Planctomycetota bacterium]